MEIGTTMKRVAFVTFEKSSNLSKDDQLAVAPLERRGIVVEPAVWSDASIRWDRFTAIILRSTWDYPQRIEEFRTWVTSLADCGLTVWNSPDLVLWNVDKSYLRELKQRGIAIPDSLWLRPGESIDLPSLMEERFWPGAVIKPTISISGERTYRISREDADQLPECLLELMRTTEVIIQEYVAEVAAEGEWSLIYFNGSFSHAVRKRPTSGDFRVQVQWGGSTERDVPPAWLIAVGENVIRRLPTMPLYARVDGVIRKDELLVMELELIEPSLFLMDDEGAAVRFAEAIAVRLF